MTGRKTVSLQELHEKWRDEPEYRAACDALDEEFALAEAVIGARDAASLDRPLQRRREVGGGKIQVEHAAMAWRLRRA